MGKLPEDKTKGPEFPKVTWLMAFRVDGKPVAKNKHLRYLPKKAREYQDQVAWSFRAPSSDAVINCNIHTFPLEGDVGIYIIFYKGLKKDGTRSLAPWDTDNHVKPIKDALDGLAYEDDKQIKWSGEEIRDCDHGQDHTMVWLGREES